MQSLTYIAFRACISLYSICLPWHLAAMQCHSTHKVVFRNQTSRKYNNKKISLRVSRSPNDVLYLIDTMSHERHNGFCIYRYMGNMVSCLVCLSILMFVCFIYTVYVTRLVYLFGNSNAIVARYCGIRRPHTYTNVLHPK